MWGGNGAFAAAFFDVMARSRETGRPRRRGCHQVRHRSGEGRCIEGRCPPNRHGDRQFTAREDRHRRGRPQLGGASSMAVGKSGCRRRPRPSLDLVRQDPRGRERLGFTRLPRGAGRRLHEAGPEPPSPSRSTWASALARSAPYTCDLTHGYISINAGLPILKIVLVSAVALIDRDSRVLLAQRPEGKSMAGLWGVSRRQGRTRRNTRNRSHP